jgi:hypothetical protein
MGGRSRARMIQKDSQTETGEVLLAPFDLVTNTSESTRAKTAETFLELLGARVRNPNTRNHGWIGIRAAGRPNDNCSPAASRAAARLPPTRMRRCEMLVSALRASFDRERLDVNSSLVQRRTWSRVTGQIRRSDSCHIILESFCQLN